MNKEQLVLQALKPKVKALGFNKNELKGVAAKIANNLTLDDDASEEDINEAIDTAVEAALPFLEFGQKQANRVINDFKKTVKPTNNDNGDDDDDDDIDTPKAVTTPKKDSDVPAWAQAMMKTMEALSGELSTMKGEKLRNHQKSRLEEELKGTGLFGQRILKSYDKMNLNEEEFEEFFDGVVADTKAYNQERANDGLKALGKSPLVGGGNKEEVLSDDEVKALANL